MAKAKKKDNNKPPPTTAQQLGSLLKSARDIIRKDKGLSGDLDRLPMLTWLLFLKFLDDKERIEAEEAKLAGSRHRPAIERPYRWRDWAAPEDGITGDALVAFINNEKATRAGGSDGKGSSRRSAASGEMARGTARTSSPRSSAAPSTG